MQTVGYIDRELYRCITDDITTDEVIITEEQIRHIKERHPGVYELLDQHYSEIVCCPDYIIKANKPNSALILKEVQLQDRTRVKLVLRLATSTDDSAYKNSIITCMKIDDKDWTRLIRNKVVLYKRE